MSAFIALPIGSVYLNVVIFTITYRESSKNTKFAIFKFQPVCKNLSQ